MAETRRNRTRHRGEFSAPVAGRACHLAGRASRASSAYGLVATSLRSAAPLDPPPSRRRSGGRATGGDGSDQGFRRKMVLGGEDRCGPVLPVHGCISPGPRQPTVLCPKSAITLGVAGKSPTYGRKSAITLGVSGKSPTYGRNTAENRWVSVYPRGCGRCTTYRRAINLDGRAIRASSSPKRHSPRALAERELPASGRPVALPTERRVCSGGSRMAAPHCGAATRPKAELVLEAPEQRWQAPLPTGEPRTRHDAGFDSDGSPPARVRFRRSSDQEPERRRPPRDARCR